MSGQQDDRKFLANILKKGWDRIAPSFTRGWSLFRINEKTRDQVRDIFHSTSDQVRGKAEETRRALKLRMAMLEIEHHLNRLYPQVGKLVCDLAEMGRKGILNDPEVKSRVELADEYRRRLKELKDEQVVLHQKQRQEG